MVDTYHSFWEHLYVPIFLLPTFVKTLCNSSYFTFVFHNTTTTFSNASLIIVGYLFSLLRNFINHSPISFFLWFLFTAWCYFSRTHSTCIHVRISRRINFKFSFSCSFSSST